jgi:hypothetical protein
VNELHPLLVSGRVGSGALVAWGPWGGGREHHVLDKFLEIGITDHGIAKQPAGFHS